MRGAPTVPTLLLLVRRTSTSEPRRLVLPNNNEMARRTSRFTLPSVPNDIRDVTPPESEQLRLDCHQGLDVGLTVRVSQAERRNAGTEARVRSPVSRPLEAFYHIHAIDRATDGS